MAAAAETGFEREPVRGGWRYRLVRDGDALTFGTLLELLADDAAVTGWFGELLAAAEPEAFFLELPALDRHSLGRPAEFVVIAAPALAGAAPDPRPFADRFAACGNQPVIAFQNLGGDALLIVPTPQGPLSAYPHLARFLRDAAKDQVRALWQTAARTVRDSLDDRPRWLSTSGLGVTWLHLRLDTRPKYYQYRPYKDPR